MDSELLTFSEAVRATGKSHGTLRRLRDEGTLVVEPREDQNQRIFVSIGALKRAGLVIRNPEFKIKRGLPYVDDSEMKRLKVELEEALELIATLRAQCEVLLAGQIRAEAVFEGTRAAYDALHRVRLTTPEPPSTAFEHKRRAADLGSDPLEASV